MLVFDCDAIVMFPYFFDGRMWAPDIEGDQYKVFANESGLSDLPDSQRLYDEAYALLTDRQRHRLDKLYWPEKEKEAFWEYTKRLSLNAEQRDVPESVAHDHAVKESAVVLGMDVSEIYPDLGWRVVVAYKNRDAFLDEQSLWKDLTSTVAKPFE